MDPILTPEQFEALRRLDSCTLANAIELFNVRLRNEGFANNSEVRSMFRHFPPMLGYAATGRIRSASPPIASSFPHPSHLSFYHRNDWWDYILSLPSPRIVVMQDIDRNPGTGALIGEIHVAICQSLGCTGYVTNGAVRDLDAVEKAGFHFFAGNVSASHAYAHVVDFGEPVEIGGLTIRSGNLIHGDRHGIQTIPKSIAAEVPMVANRIAEEERRIINFCKSQDFDLRKLRELVKGADDAILSSVPKKNTKWEA